MDVCAYMQAGRSTPPLPAESLAEHLRTERIRAAFGGSQRRRVPKVDAAALRRYYRHLYENLSLPFAAWYPEPAPASQAAEYPWTVVALFDPATGPGDEFDGIFCKIRQGHNAREVPLIELDLPPDDPNFQLVETYWDWFWHWR